MTYKQIIKDLHNKIYRPIYLLMGEEPYFIDEITNYIANHVLTEEEKAFNQVVYYGKDTDVGTIINAAKRYPMMANHQVIIVKEAQALKDFDTLIHYIKRPLKSTILVLSYNYKSLDKRRKIFTAFEKNALVFESKKLYENEIPDWINHYVKRRSISIEAKAAAIASIKKSNI
mgnify:FL=1